MGHILVLDAGGTISSAADGQGALRARAGALAGVLDKLPTSALVRSVYQGLSEEMSLAQASGIVAAALDAASDPEIDGIVVAHGTDTLEETAFLADLQWPRTKPLVFTGAQRPPDAADFDGARNLGEALAAAAPPAAARHGVLVCFGGRLLPAWGVYKRHTSDLEGFAHRLGLTVDLDAPAAPLTATAAPLAPGPCDDTVALVSLGLGGDGWLIDAAVDHGARGLVLAAFGRGNANDSVVEAVRRACAAGAVVLVASRCPEGNVSPDYATGLSLEIVGAIFVKDLGASQARVLLAKLLLDVEGKTARTWFGL